MEGNATRRKALKLASGAGTSAVMLSGNVFADETTIAHTVSDDGNALYSDQYRKCSPSISKREHSSDEWRMARHDPARTGSTAASAPTDPRPDLNWRYDGDGNSVLTPVGIDSRVLVTESAPSSRTTLLDSSSGQLTQLIDHGGIANSSPVFGRRRMYLSYHGGSKEGRSGTVIEARESGNGARAWNSGISEDPISAKLLLGNTVIIGTRGSSPVVRAVDGTAGEACWEVSLDEPNTEITGLAFRDGRIYVTSAGIAGDTLDTGYCIALEPETGKRRWMTKFSQPVHDVSVSEQGPLVRTSNSVCSLDSASGTELWHRAAGGGAREAPVVKNGTVFVGENHKLSARDLNDGELLWSTRISSNVVRVRAGTQSLYYTTDAIGTGEAVVGSIGVDGDVTWSRQLGNRRTTAPIIFDGQLILGAIMKPRALPGTESYTSASVEIIAYT